MPYCAKSGHMSAVPTLDIPVLMDKSKANASQPIILIMLGSALVVDGFAGQAVG